MIVGVTGHQELPASALDPIREEIEAELADIRNLRGVCSLASGADQMFARTVLRFEGQLHVVIPCAGYESTFTDRPDLEEFHRLVAAASQVDELDYPEPSEKAFFAAGRRVVDLADRLVAVWDGEPAQGLGGTADVVHYAESLHKPVAVVWPAGAKR